MFNFYNYEFVSFVKSNNKTVKFKELQDPISDYPKTEQ